MITQELSRTSSSTSALDALAATSTVVADTGDFASIARFKPQDATTNPSLVLSALKSHPILLASAVVAASEIAGGDVLSGKLVADVLNALLACKLLKEVSGFVSMEVPADLSFDTQATIEKAKFLLTLVDELGGDRTRILIKVAATWEGVLAVKSLEADGIKCNVTLVFCLSQAVLAAQSKAFLISPFVGRVFDWHVKNKLYDPEETVNDPGVQFVQLIRGYFKQNDIKTVVMAASFRRESQIFGLAGTDKLTISVDLLSKLQKAAPPVSPIAERNTFQSHKFGSIDVSETGFRHALNKDRMASYLLNDGIRRFEKDTKTLETIVQKALGE